jgi:hypothetical protein
LKNRFLNNAKSQDPSFLTQYNALWHLANLGRLSRHNVIWLGKQIIRMTEAWGGNSEQQEMIEQLRERQARAWKRWEKRIAERAAAKAASAGKRGKKNQPTTPAPPEPPAPNLDPWELL